MKCVKLAQPITGAEVIIRADNQLAADMVTSGQCRPTTKGAWKRVNRGARQKARMEAAERRFKSKAARRAEKQRRAFAETLAKSDERGRLQKGLDAAKKVLKRRAKKT